MMQSFWIGPSASETTSRSGSSPDQRARPDTPPAQNDGTLPGSRRGRTMTTPSKAAFRNGGAIRPPDASWALAGSERKKGAPVGAPTGARTTPVQERTAGLVVVLGVGEAHGCHACVTMGDRSGGDWVR
jgi:hypothetical protein